MERASFVIALIALTVGTFYKLAKYSVFLFSFFLNTPILQLHENIVFIIIYEIELLFHHVQGSMQRVVLIG